MRDISYMETTLTKLFKDVGIDLADERAKYYLELEKLQLIEALSEYHSETHGEPANYYYLTYESTHQE